MMKDIDSRHITTMSRETAEGASSDGVTPEERTSEQASGTELEQALSKLSVKQQGTSGEKIEDDERISPAKPEVSEDRKPSIAAQAGVGVTKHLPPLIDMALVDAMRVPRDKVFVVQNERDMEVKVKDDTVQEWDLPLMNSYHRLLVHRIAEHFRLSHTIDPTTKQVTLSKTDETRVPATSISTLAANERLSEPVAFPPLLNSLSGQSTPNAPSGSGIRIMRRPDGTSRSDSPRNGSSTPEGSQRDRRNMTIEEREARYSEARQRIFGSQGNGDEQSAVDADRDSNPQGPAEVLGGNASRKVSSGGARSVTTSTSSTSDSGTGSMIRNAVGGAGEDRFSPTSEVIPSAFDPAGAGLIRQVLPNHYAYPPLMDQQQAAAYYNQGGGYLSGPVQVDAQGRPIMYTMMNGQQWQYAAPYAYMNGQPLHYGYNTPPMGGESLQSPAASSRSTSLSAGTESADSARSSISEQVTQQVFHNTSSHHGTPINRSQSVSPTAAFPNQPQQRLASPPVGQVAQGNGPQCFVPQNQGAPWPLMYMHHPTMQGYSPAQSYTPPSPMDFSGATRSGLMRPMTANGPTSAKAASTPPLPTYGASTEARFGSGYGRPSLNGSMAQQSGVSGVDFGASHASLGTGPSRGRGRSSQGSERSLYDPNKASQPSTSSPHANVAMTPTSSSGARHSLGKSSSAAAVLENGVNAIPHSRMDGLPMTPTTPSAFSGGRSGAAALSQGSRNGALASGSIRSLPSASSFTAPIHPSLPARPDWAIAERQSSSGQSNGSGSGISSVRKVSAPGDAPAHTCPSEASAQAKLAESDQATALPRQSDLGLKEDSATSLSRDVEHPL